MPGIPVVIVTSGGLGVTVAPNGLPMTIGTTGIAVRQTTNGLPVSGITFGPDVTAPIITSANTVSWPENSVLNHVLAANETVTWAKVGGADTAKFTLVGNILTLPAKDYEAPDDADANRSYIVQVQATDTSSNPSTIQTITVTITDVLEIDYLLTMGSGSYVLTGITMDIIETVGGGDEAETTAWVAAVVTAGGTVSGARKTIVNTFIAAMKAAGLWTTLDRYWLLAGENEGSAKVDLKGLTSFTLGGTGPLSARLTANVGYTGNGTDNYLDTGVNLSTLAGSGGQFSANSATVGCQIQNNRITDANTYAWGVADTGFTTLVNLAPLAAANQIFRINNLTSTGAPSPSTTTRRSWLTSRTSATVQAIYFDGTLSDNDNQTVIGIPSAILYIGALNYNGPFANSFLSDTLSCFYFGSGWSGAQVTTFEGIQNAMMTSIGINVH